MEDKEQTFNCTLNQPDKISANIDCAAQNEASFIQRGEKGPKGDKGEKGDTGETGPQGPQGPQGDDGYSPSASVVKIGTEATITITDKTGTTTARIFDGNGNVDDVKVNGTSVVTNKVANVSVPTAVSDLTNDAGYQNATQVDTAVTSYHDSSKQNITDNNLQTTSKTIVGAINEVNAEIQSGANVDLSNLSADGEAKFDAKVDVESLSEVNPMIESYVNGTSGYRIWSDGYCEQWGVLSSNFGTDVRWDVTFLKTFKDTNYSTQTSVYGNYSSSNISNVEFKSVGNMYGYSKSSTTSVKFVNWRACGYLAEGQY